MRWDENWRVNPLHEPLMRTQLQSVYGVERSLNHFISLRVSERSWFIRASLFILMFMILWYLISYRTNKVAQPVGKFVPAGKI